MARSINTIDNKKNRMTKAELNARQKWEDQLKTGRGIEPSPAVKADPESLDEFMRLKAVFNAVGLDDSLIERSVNGYVEIGQTLRQLKAERESIRQDMENQTEQRKKIALYNLMDAKDRTILKYYDLRFAIAKENALTVSGRLRVIPKNQQEEPGEVTGIAAYMKNKGK